MQIWTLCSLRPMQCCVQGSLLFGSPESFCIGFIIDIQDLITCAKFGENRLRRLGVARGQISGFLVDLPS